MPDSYCTCNSIMVRVGTVRAGVLYCVRMGPPLIAITEPGSISRALFILSMPPQHLAA